MIHLLWLTSSKNCFYTRNILASIVIIMGFLYRYFGEVQENGLKDELELSIAAIEQEGDNYLKKIQSDHYRITWIAGDGMVLYDTITGTENKENHLERIVLEYGYAYLRFLFHRNNPFPKFR